MQGESHEFESRQLHMKYNVSDIVYWSVHETYKSDVSIIISYSKRDIPPYTLRQYAPNKIFPYYGSHGTNESLHFVEKDVYE